jgi:hypothetical protein
MNANEPGEFCNNFQNSSERLKLKLKWDTRSGIQPNFADDCTSLSQLPKSLSIEGILGFAFAWMATYTPCDVRLKSVDNQASFVEGKRHSKDHTRACQFARGSVRVEMCVCIKWWKLLHRAINLL